MGRPVLAPQKLEQLPGLSKTRIIRKVELGWSQLIS